MHQKKRTAIRMTACIKKIREKCMKRKATTAHMVRIVLRLAFLALAGFFFFQGKMHYWIALFCSGLLFSLIFSRFYCGWICPMNTLFRPISWLYGKLGIRRNSSPLFMSHPVVRVVCFGLFAGLLLLIKRHGIKVPPLAVITAFSVLVVLIFDEALWHNRICPFGTVMSLSARMGNKHYTVKEDLCIACGKCQKVCPAHAIDTLVSTKRFIRKADCLACGACAAICPTRAIQYRA